jgi:hypothetical protein
VVTSTLPCPTCGRTVTQGCWTVSGHVALKTPHTRQADQTRGWNARDTYVPPVVVTEPKHPIPAGAVTVPPGGTCTPGKVNVLAGTYPGFSQTFPNGTKTTILVPEGQTAVLDGKGARSAIVAGGKVDLFGDLRVTGYAPTSTENGSNVAVYYGGTAAGSEIDGPTIGSKMAALGFEVPLILTKLTVDTCGYSGIMGTTADGTVFGDVGVYRVNRDNHGQDGQLGAIKITRSANLRFTKAVHVEDTGGANGIWTDVSCRNPIVAGSKVLTGAGKAAAVGLLLEETEGGYVVGAEIEGVFAINLLATGHVKVWSTKATGSVAMSIQQDRAKNSGTSDTQPNLSQTSAPWWAVGNEVCNSQLVATSGFKIALMAYADGPATGFTGAQMLAGLRGNTYTGSVQFGRTDGGRDTLTATQLAATLGARFSPTPQDVPAEVAGMLA